MTPGKVVGMENDAKWFNEIGNDFQPEPCGFQPPGPADD